MGEALQSDHSRTRAANQALFPPELFAAVLLRRPFDPLSHAEAPYVRWATEEAARWHASGRAPTSERALAYLFTYGALRDRAKDAERVPVPEHAPRWQRTLAAACNLRHRQRAAVCLRYCASLDEDEIAAALGVRSAQVGDIIGGAVGSIVRTLGERVDVRRGLRMAAGRLRRGLEEDRARGAWDRPLYPLQTAPGPGEPREVIKAWITAPLATEGGLRRRLAAASSAPAVFPRNAPVLALLHEAYAPAALPREPEPARSVPPPRPAAPAPVPSRWRAAIAVAAAMLVSAVLVPVSASDGPRQERTAVVADIAPLPGPDEVRAATALRVAGRAFTRVVRGDSLWTIADRTYDDPMRWADIWRMNKRRRMTGGERFTDANLIKPGWVLRMPAG